MSHNHTHDPMTKKHAWIALAAVGILLCGVFAYAYMRTVALDSRVLELSAQLASTSASLAENVALLNSQTEGIAKNLDSTKQDVAAATSNIYAVQNQVGGVEQTVGSISGTVSTLQKLSSIDPELLKKYSKVYFLNENYTPAHLSTIPQADVYSNTKSEEFLSEALPFLRSLLSAAKSNGITLYVDSAYRSFDTQEALKSAYRVTYGAGTANAFSADQGYSEHQLGVTVDFLTTGLGGQLTTDFDKTAAFTWLKNNAHRFGFEMSYPKGNTFYVYEPWHWRYVGVQLATYLHTTNSNFYDMDQRDIDKYLATLFD